MTPSCPEDPGEHGTLYGTEPFGEWSAKKSSKMVKGSGGLMYYEPLEVVHFPTSIMHKEITGFPACDPSSPPLGMKKEHPGELGTTAQ